MASNISVWQDEQLDRWNTRLSEVLLPHTVIMYVYIVLGVVGNLTVIYVYTFRIREQASDDRYFIPFLAVVDGLACLVSCVGNLIINSNPVRYSNAILCKGFYAGSYVTATSSGLLLTVIAIQRFQKLCRPLSSQMNLKTRRRSILIVLLSALVMSLPCFATFGIAKVSNEVTSNLTVHYCTEITVNGSQVIPRVYNTFLFLICVGNLIVLCTLYSLIGKKLYMHMKSRKRRQIEAEETLEYSTEAVTFHIEHLAVQTNRIQKVGNRFSVMFIIITVTYVVCFFTASGTLFWNSLDTKIWPTKSDWEMVVFRFTHTVFVINYLVNPIVYGFFDSLFRNQILTGVKRVKMLYLTDQRV